MSANGGSTVESKPTRPEGRWQRLEVLAERALAALEEREEAPTARELNSIRRLLDRLDADRELARIRGLTTD